MQVLAKFARSPQISEGGCAAEGQAAQQRQEPTRDLLPCTPRGAPLLRPAGRKPPRNFHLHRKESRGLCERRPAHADPCEICSFPAGNGGLCIFGRFRTRNEGVCIASRGQRNPNPAETPGQMQESEDPALKSRANPLILCAKTGFPANPLINMRPSRRKSRGLRNREPARAKSAGVCENDPPCDRPAGHVRPTCRACANDPLLCALRGADPRETRTSSDRHASPPRRCRGASPRKIALLPPVALVHVLGGGGSKPPRNRASPPDKRGLCAVRCKPPREIRASPARNERT